MSSPSATTAPTASASEPAQKRRFNYTLEFKMRVIEFAEASNNCQASNHFHVPRQCIQSWRKMKNELILEENQGKSKKKRLQGGGRPLKNVEVDEKLEEWLREKRAELGEKGKITGKMIKDYAMTISGNVEFKASNGWLQRFMVRHGLAPPTRIQKALSPSESDDSEVKTSGTEEFLIQLLQSDEWKELIGHGAVEEAESEEAEPEEEEKSINLGAELEKLFGNNGGEGTSSSG